MKTQSKKKRSTVKTQSIVRRESAKPWMVNAEETAILKNSVCRGASDAELKFALLVAARYRLDPFKKQIWFVPRWDSKAENSNGKTGSRGLRSASRHRWITSRRGA